MGIKCMYNMVNKVRINIYIHKTQNDELEKLSEQSGESKASLIRQAINDLLKKLGIRK